MMKRFLLFIIVVICSFQAANGQGLSKIEMDLYQLVVQGGDDLFDVNIVLTEQYRGERTTYDFITKSSKRRFVIEQMKQFSQTSQSDLITHVRSVSKNSQVSGVRPYWIANMICCKADSRAILDIAAHPDVLSVGLNKLQKMLPDMEVEKDDSDSKEITYNISKVNADAVWDIGYTGENVIVAILDSGVNYDHEDIRDNMWQDNNYPFHGYDFINGDNDPKDDYGHGSHCAGTVAGTGAAGSRTGMAPGAHIMAIKVIDSDGYGNLESIMAGIEFAIENNADILNMSLGFRGGGEAERIAIRSSMVNLLEVGLIVSASAGNEGSEDDQMFFPIPNNVGLPGACPPPWLHPDQIVEGGLSAAVCVGATDVNDVIAPFSSIGPTTWQDITGFEDYPYNPGMGLIRPDVCAPGVAIKSLAHKNNSGYLSANGTSMSAPCVSGVMALLLSKNPDLTPSEICKLLETTAVQLSDGKSNIYGSGRIDALAAIEAAPFGMFLLEKIAIDDSEGNNDQKMNPGETINLSVTLKNISGALATDVEMILSSSNDWITFNNNTNNISVFASGETMTIDGAFSFALSADAVSKRNIYFTLELKDDVRIANIPLKIVVYDHQLEYDRITINDSGENQNNMLDPGETAEMVIHIKNTGNESAYIEYGKLTTTEPSLLTIHNPEISACAIPPDEMATITFNVTLNEEAVIEYLNVPLLLCLTDNKERTMEFDFFYEYPCFTPLNFKVESISQKASKISWNANNKDISYNIYRNGELLKKAYPNTSYTDYGLESSVKYCYNVTAICVDNVESEHTEDMCVGAANIEKLFGHIKIYPNPARDFIYVEGENLKKIAVYNVLGEIIKDVNSVSAQTKIDAADLKTGVYIIEIINQDGIKLNKKLIIQH